MLNSSKGTPIFYMKKSGEITIELPNYPQQGLPVQTGKKNL